jgi:hypothetical protein
MAIQIINIGTYVNDGTGDDIRTAFQKINANFSELNLTRGQNNTASNIGIGAGVYKEKIGVDLRLRSIKGGSGITVSPVSPTDNEITITNNGHSFGNIITDDSTTISASSHSDSLSIVGGVGISTHAVGGNLVINNDYTDYSLSRDTMPVLGGNLHGNSFDILNVDQIQSNNVESLVYGIDIRTVNVDATVFDFGNFNNTFSNVILWLLASSTSGDMGTFSVPSGYGIDLSVI